jgi:hypothetical protein
MSPLKSQLQRARVIIDSLTQGIHPKSGTELPEDSVVNEIEIHRAMATAVLAIDQVTARLARRSQLPGSVGKTWSDKEEQSLRKEFANGDSVEQIAKKHGRTTRAIEARLVRIGLLEPDLRTASPLLTMVDTKEQK